MQKIFTLLIIMGIPCAPLMGMSNQVTPIKDPPPYDAFISSQQVHVDVQRRSLITTSQSTQTDDFYAPQIPTNLHPNNWLLLVAAMRALHNQNQVNVNQSEQSPQGEIRPSLTQFCTMHEHNPSDERCGLIITGCCINTVCCPLFGLLDLACAPAVYWRRTNRPSNAGRNQYCFYTRNAIALCVGIHRMEITGTSADRVDCTFNCGTRGWNDTSADEQI